MGAKFHALKGKSPDCPLRSLNIATAEDAEEFTEAQRMFFGVSANFSAFP